MVSEEEEFESLCKSLKDKIELDTFMRLLELKQEKLLRIIKTSPDKELLWDVRNKFTCVVELKREIAHNINK